MKYDFTTVPDHRDGTSIKWNEMYKIKPNVKEGVVPLSVADMEFSTAPEIVNGLKNYLDTHALGYTEATDGYFNAVIDWMKKHHQFAIKKEWIVETAGVVPGFGTVIEALSKPGDGVLLLTPVYYPMSISINARGRKLVESPLVLTDKGYEIDFEDFENKAKDENVKLFLFCSPHNPIGRVWTKEELAKISDICLRNHVFIIDDEIHNDLIMPGYEHTVLATLSEEALQNCVVCTAPSKTFSLAGMQTSNLIVANEEKRKAILAEQSRNFALGLNALGYEACRIAYTECEEWLSECIKVIHENALYIEAFLSEKMPFCKVFPLQGTYLLWVDFRGMGMDHEQLEQFMQQKAEIFTDEGYVFGEAGKGFERFNLACPKQVIVDTFDRLYKAYCSLSL